MRTCAPAAKQFSITKQLNPGCVVAQCPITAMILMEEDVRAVVLEPLVFSRPAEGRTWRPRHEEVALWHVAQSQSSEISPLLAHMHPAWVNTDIGHVYR